MISDGISEGHVSERTIDCILEKVLGRNMNVVDMLESHEGEEEDDEEEEDEEEDDEDDEEEEEEEEGGSLMFLHY